MKRFTETLKWDDPWFQMLPLLEKTVFLYLIDRCDNAGFWESNTRSMSFQIGVEQADCEGALKALARGIEGASGWYWVKNFLKHQKNLPLNASNPAHRQIIALLQDQSERFPSSQKHLPEGASKGLPSPIGIGNGQVKVSSPRKKKEVEITPEMARIGKILGRRETTLWQDNEIQAFRKCDFQEDEIQRVEAFYKFEERQNEPLHRRTNFLALLNHWPDEVNKSALWAKKYGWKPTIAPDPSQPLLNGYK